MRRVYITTVYDKDPSTAREMAYDEASDMALAGKSVDNVSVSIEVEEINPKTFKLWAVYENE